MNLLTKLVTGVFGSVWGYVVVAAVSASLATAGATYATYTVQHSKYLALQYKDAKNATLVAQEQASAEEEVAAKQHAVDTANTVAAVSESAAQPRIITKFQTLIKEIPVALPPTVKSCVPVSLLWLYNDAVERANSEGADDLGTAATTGELDDSCSSIPVSDFAKTLIDNIKIGAQNAEQLDALEAAVRSLVAKANSAAPSDAQPPDLPRVSLAE